MLGTLEITANPTNPDSTSVYKIYEVTSVDALNNAVQRGSVAGVDIMGGTPDEFDSHAADIKDRIVLVRHELMFAAGTIHRRRKYDMARAHGAVGFLIAGPLAGHVVAGSSGRQSGEGIPALIRVVRESKSPKLRSRWTRGPRAGR